MDPTKGIRLGMMSWNGGELLVPRCAPGQGTRLTQALREVQNLKLVTTVNSVGNRSKTQEMRTEMANRTNVRGGTP